MHFLEIDEHFDPRKTISEYDAEARKRGRVET
jgi:hypothetical protein